MKRIFLLLLALTLLLLPACAEEPDIDVDGEIHTSRVEDLKVAEYGDYIYYASDFMWRYNRKTGEMSRLCDDTAFNPSCVLCSVMKQTAQIVNERLYFNGYLLKTRENYYAYYDLVTGETKVLHTVTNHEKGENFRPVLADGWLYYTARRLREGGDVTNSKDYESFVGRMPMDGGETEFVCLIEDAYFESIHAVIDGRVITTCHDIIYAIDISTGERTVIFDPEEHGFMRYFTYSVYLDGHIYGLIGTDDYFVSEYHPYKVMKYYLLRINVCTGEMKQLVEEPVYGLIVTDNAFYYTEQTIRYFSSPENYIGKPQDIPVTGSYETLYACDLDGGNRREVFSTPNLILDNYLNRIIDGCLYGRIFEYVETENQIIDYFGKLDLATGEITPATEVK